PRRCKAYAKGAANGPHAAALVTRRRPQADTARGEPRGGGFSRRARVDPFRAPPDLGNAGAARPGRILHSRLGHRALPVVGRRDDARTRRHHVRRGAHRARLRPVLRRFLGVGRLLRPTEVAAVHSAGAPHGWTPPQTLQIPDWCGCSTEYVPVPTGDGWWQ